MRSGRAGLFSGRSPSWSGSTSLNTASFRIHLRMQGRILARRVDIDELQLIEPPIRPQTAQQVLMRALVDDPAMLQHDNAVGAAHGGEPVRNDEHRAVG